MGESNQPYTLGIWTVRPGKGAAFVKVWEEFAKWTAQNIAGSGTGYLLQDSANPDKYISFGQWENGEVVSAWRERPEFKAFAAKARDLCSEFQPHSMMLVASSEE